MIKYTIEEVGFQVDISTGELFVIHGDKLAKIENNVAIELTEILRQKLYLYKDQQEGILKRLFK
jgi:hypothetical protein